MRIFAVLMTLSIFWASCVSAGNSYLSLALCHPQDPERCGILIINGTFSVVARDADRVLAQDLFPNITITTIDDSYFNQLMRVSSAGFALAEKDNKHGERLIGGTARDQVLWLTVDQMWRTLPSSALIKGAEMIPPQTESWTCGPNSGARACVMLGRTMRMYDYFMNHCPKSLGSPNTLGGHITSIVTFVGLIAHALPDVGPTPSELAGYLDQQLPSYSVNHVKMGCWEN